MKFTEDLVERIEETGRLDLVARAMDTGADRLGATAQAALAGDWLGHPLHPALTDLPIGFWTSSFVLDFVGGRRARSASQRLIALGVLSVVPTAATGLVDWRRGTAGGDRRVGVVHAVSNVSATVLYALSWNARRRNRQLRGVVIGVAAATVATLAGYLGGHLAFSNDGDGHGDVQDDASHVRSATAVTPVG